MILSNGKGLTTMRSNEDMMSCTIRVYFTVFPLAGTDDWMMISPETLERWKDKGVIKTNGQGQHYIVQREG